MNTVVLHMHCGIVTKWGTIRGLTMEKSATFIGKILTFLNVVNKVSK